MALKFDITGDNRNLLNALDGARNGVHRAAQDIEKSGIGIEEMFKRIAAAAGIAFSMEGAKSFLTKVVEMRSYFQDIESSMEVFLGSAEKGQKFMEDLKAAAYYNMFEFTDLANASKQLIAYKNDIDTVIPTIQKLSDVAVGTSAPLLDLVNLYNKAKSTGKVSTQDLYSWAVKGVVVKDVLKEMGEEADGTAVTFEQLNKVLDHITSEGGMFYNLQSKMMSNISAEIGQFQDNLALMLNGIGEKYQDQITGAIKLGSELIDNYQVIAGWIKDIVIAYGTYRAVLATCLAIDKAVVYWKGLQAEATMMNTLANTSETVSVTALTIAKLRLTAATKALTTAILANPYVIVAAGVATLTYAIYKLATAETDLEEAQKKVDEAFEDTLAEMKSEQTEIDRLFGKLKKAKEGTEEYKKVKDQILGQYGKYLQGLSDEISTLKDVEGAYKAVTKAAREASIARGKEAALKDVQDTYGSNYASSMGNLQAALNSRVGGEKAANALKLIQSELQKTGTISTETEKKVRELFRGTADYGNSGAWITGLRNNEKMLADHTKLVEERFQTEEEEEKEHVEEKKVRNKQAIEEEKKNLQAQLDNLSKEEAIGKKGIDLKKKIKALEKELKAYNASDKSGKSGKDHTAEQDATRRQKLFEQDMAAEESQSKQKRELRDALRDLEIANEQDNAKRELLQMQKDHEDKLAAIREQADQWKKEAYKAAEERWNATNKDKTKAFSDTPEGKAGWQGQKLTTEQDHTIQARVNAEITNYLREESALYKSHYDSIISSHQSYSDKKLAIDRKYREEALVIDKAIAEAEKNNDRKAVEQLKRTRAELEKDHAKQQADLSLEQLKLDPNYIRAFEDLDNTSTETLEHLIKMFEESKQAAGKSLDPKDLKEYTSAIQQMQDKMTERDPFKALAQSSRELTEAHKRVKKAEEDLETVRKGGFIQIMDVDKKTGEVTFHILEQAEAENRLREAKDGVIKAASKYNKAQQAAFAIIENLGNSVSNLGDSIGGTAGKIVSLIGDVISFASGAITALGKTTEGVSKAIQAAEKASAILAIISAVLQIVTKITDIMGADYESYDRLVGQYENLCDVWNELINKKKEYISISYGTEILKVGAEELYILNRQIEAYRTLGRERLNSGASIGSHSIGVRIKNGMALSDWDDIRNVLGDYDLGGRLEGLFDLSAEQLEKLREGAPAFWSKLDEDVRKYLNGIIDGAKEIDDAIKQINERLTGTTSEDVFEKLMNSLYDFADGSEDAFDEIEKNWQRMINKMVLDNVIAKDLQDKVEDWYKRLADFQKKRNGYTSEEMEALNAEKAAIEEELATRERDFFNNPFNLMSQKAIEKYFKKRDELLKRLEEINNTNTEPLTDEEYQQGLEAFYEEYSKLLDLPIEKIKELTDMGFIKPVSDAIDEVAEKFGDLHSKFIDTLMDMEFDAEEWKKELQQTMLKDLIEQNVLNVPITVTVDGQEQVFDNFDAYAKEWNKRYNDALKAGDEAAIQALIDELIEQQGLMAKAAEDYRQRMQEATDTTFKDMSDSWTSTLMDMTKSADDWSQDVGRIMAEKIISQMVAPVMMQPLLDKLQDAFNTAMSADEATWKSVMTDGSVLAALDTIKDAYPELQEVVKQIMQALGVTVNEEAKEGFSDLKGTIISALMDSDGDIKKFAADLGKGMVEQMVKAMTDQKYGEQIKALNEEWASALESGDPARIEAVKQKVLELYAAIGNDEEIKKLLDDIRELGESTPFDNLQDSFLSTLMNMEGSADDFVKDLKQKLAEALVNDIVIGKDFADKLEYYKEQYKRIMGDPSLSDEERAKAIRDLADTWREYTEGKKAEADEINKWLGTYEHEDQQATMNMANAATYDQFELYLGMATSHLMVAEQHKEISRQILETLQGMNGLTKPGTNYGEQIFMRLGTTNEYLLAIKKELIGMHSEFGAKFDNMNSHLNKL
jgi:hypothetical protein